MRRVLLLLATSYLLATASLAQTLRFWAVTGSADDSTMYKEIGADFEKKTGIKVDVSPLAWGNFESKYFTAMAAGMPPDAGATNLGGPFNYGTVGGLVDLRGTFPAESKELESKLNPAMLPMFSVGKKLYGIPTDVGILVLVYRKDIFERLGIKPPATWNELNATIAKLEANHYRYYYNWTLGAQWALNMYTMPYGVSGIEVDASGKTKLNWNEPNYQKGVLQALNLWYMHDSPGKDLGSRAIGLFASDKPGEGMPLIIDLFSMDGQIRKLAPQIDGKWGVVAWPTAETGKPFHVMGGITYVVFRKSKHQREAFEWVKYLSSQEVQEKIFLNRYRRKADPGFTIPAITSFWNAEGANFWKREELKPVQELKNVVAEVYKSLGTTPQVQGSTEVTKLESNMLDSMKTWIDDTIAGLATKQGTTRSELMSAFGRGEFAADRASLYAETAAKLKENYASLLPKAEQLLSEAEGRQARRTSTVLGHLDEFEKASSVLTLLERALVVAAILVVGAVAFKPKLRKHALSYLYIAFPVLVAAVFVFLPALTALYLSFTEYHPVLPLSTAQWTGISNYRESIQSGEIGSSLAKSLYYVLGTLPIGIALALGCALLLNARPRGEHVWRFLFFSPLVTSAISVALIFSQLFLGTKDGWLNTILAKLHLTTEPIAFLTSEHTFLKCVMILAIWHGIAFTSVVFLAGLQQIPASLFEAAHLDGAPPWVRLKKIVLPGIRPQMLFVTTLGVIGSFQVFETIFLLANKSADAGARFGPNDSGLTTVPLIFHQGFESLEMGKSSANAYILFAIILTLTAIQIKFFQPEGSQA